MDLRKTSEILRAIGHPVRLAILAGLRQDRGCNVNTIVKRLKVPQSTVSQHLSVLKSRGVIEPRKEGVKTCYTISDSRLHRLLDLFE